MIPGTDTETFKEVNMDIRVLLALRAERANKKVYFIIFTERVADYVIANEKNGRGIKIDLRKLQDMNTGFKTKHNPKIINNGEKKDKDKNKMYQELINI